VLVARFRRDGTLMCRRVVSRHGFLGGGGVAHLLQQVGSVLCYFAKRHLQPPIVL
jgi:hypothetical protein